MRLRHLLQVLLCFALHTATAATDNLKWPAGQVPGGQTNGPDTLDDIWQGLYNAWALDPIADADKDGCSNAIESVAGTNPFLASDCLKIGNTSITGANIIFTTKIEAGKKYRVLSSDSPTGPTWTAVTMLAPINALTYTPSADAASYSISVVKATGTSKFYRLESSDTDSDGDGVSDWAERKLGLNPAAVDSDLDGVSDGVMVATELATPDVVTIAAVEPFASEDSTAPAEILIRRSRKLLPVTVNYSVTGSATSNTDFTAAPSTTTVSLPVGTTAAAIDFTPIADTLVEGGESITVTLTGATNGTASPPTLGTPNNASVIITNATTATGTGLMAYYYDTASTTAADSLNFGQVGTYSFTRNTTPTTQGSIVIPYTGTPALAVGHVVKVSFTSGNLNSSLYNHANYSVTSVTAGTNFTLAIVGATALPTSGTGSCSFSIQSFPHPAALQRVDPVVNNDWQYGTPNGVVLATHGAPRLANFPDDYSDTFETYLVPTTAGSYQFQLDADDKARVFIDVNLNGTFEASEQILEHGWDTAATVTPEDGVADDEVIGTFKVSAAITLAVPATPAARYKMRVEHVETTGDARCRLQWRLGTASFANIAQANQFTHTLAATYTSTTTIATVTLTAHGLVNGDSVALAFSSGLLFTPTSSNGSFTVANVTANTFDVPVIATATSSGSCFLEGRTASTTTGVYNKTYAGTTLAGPPLRIGVDAAITTGNNGIWNTGTPDVNLINPDTFSIRWSGQVQPQFTEEYTFTVVADDGCTLMINGQIQPLKMLPSAQTGGSTYTYDAATGNTVVNYAGLAVPAGNFLVGETLRFDPSSGNLAHAPTVSPTYSYDAATGLAVIDYTNLTVGQPGGTMVAASVQVGETVELDPTSGTLSALGTTPYVVTAVAGSTLTVSFGTGTFATGTGTITFSDNRNAIVTSVHATGTGTYSYNTTTGDAVVTYTALGLPAGTFVNGQNLALDPSSGNLNSLAATQNSAFKTISGVTATTFTVNYGAGVVATGTGNITIVAPASASVAQGITNAISVSFGPGKYAANSVGSMNIDISNKPMKDWSSNGNERYVRIPMVGGTRYDIQLDMYENTSSARAILSWFSPSQSKEVVPSNRLYPSTGTVAPPVHVADTYATGLVGGPFSQVVAGSNGATVTLSGAPAWLTYSNGVLSGTPPAGSSGDYQILITLTNAAGSSKSLLNLHIDAAGGNVVREVWSSVTGTTVATIPTGTTATTTSTLTSVATPSGAINYGERIRGYITAPTTGNYYFWLAANDGAELWISNDAESVNIFKRANTTSGSAVPQTWSAEASQKSGWLALDQGQRYYFEILHKAGATTGADNLALGWSKPGEATTVPSEVVPGYVISPYVPPAVGAFPGTLYIATMLSQSGAATNGVGNATLRISDDENTGYMTRSYSGLSGPITSEHIHTDPYLAKPSTIIFDIDAPVTAGDGLITNTADPHYTGSTPQTGTYKWTILPVGTLTKADIIEIIKQGKAYINLHTAAYPNGEIRGNYTLAAGSRTFTAPPAPPAWTSDHTTNNGAARFLTQATFGPNPADIAALKAMASYEAWIDNQFTLTATPHLPETLAREIADVFGPFDVKVAFNSWWKNSMTAPDQLRQRVAFALSEIHVISGSGPLEDNSRAMSDFYDTLAANAFGNFRTLLTDTTLTPAMGRYLDMLRNDKPDLTVGRIPNENYAREIKQLFSIGLYRQWPDGTLMLTSTDSPIDTYTQREIVGLAHVFTGWDYGYDGAMHTSFSSSADWTRPMRETPLRHFTGTKRFLNNEVLPGLITLGGQTLDPYATHLVTQYNDPAYNALPGQELAKAHDILFNHPNVGPFICRQLIQRLITSNPSRDYLYRVVQKFNDNGSGVRGDMKAVIKAILLDYEARSPTPVTVPAYGKQREPLLKVAAAHRAFRPSNLGGTYAQTGALASNVPVITITTASTHSLVAGNQVFLEFTDATTPTAQLAPSTGVYTVLSSPAPTTTTYAVNAPGWMGGTYSQAANSTTMTVTMSGHWLPAGGQAYFDFTSGTADGLAAFDRTVLTAVTSNAFDTPSGVGNTSGTTFTLTAPTTTTARSGSLMIARLGGTYQCSTRGGTLTVDTYYGGSGTWGTMADHGAIVGDNVFLNFTESRDTTSGNETSTENDLVYPVITVPDSNTLTFTARDAANAVVNSGNGVIVFPLKAQPLVRNGTVNARASTYSMNNTDADIGQTPINSPTVFNYFLPEFKYPGALASQGITTPEFQGTAETTIIRFDNYLYNGVFNPGNTNGIASFSTGNNALVMDLAPWMGNAVATSGVGLILGGGPQIAQPWTSNANVSTLIDRLNTILMAGQLTATAKTAILQYIGGPLTSVTLASPAVFTMPSAHGLAVDDVLIITGVTGGTYTGAATAVNGTFRVASVPTTTTFTLKSTTTTTGLNCTVVPTSLSVSNAGFDSYTNTSNTSATALEKTDRIRSIIHFLITSADFSIQR